MIQKSAIISECGRYRYTLTRKWSEQGGRVVFLLFNPSTADGTNDDATIRKCMGFASRWGYGEMVVINLFAYRSRNPDSLHYVDDPIGPKNDAWIGTVLADADVLVCAWGCEQHMRSKESQQRVTSVLLGVVHRWQPKLRIRCLGLTKGGAPRHPLMLAYTTPFVDFFPVVNYLEGAVPS